ncbi:MAG: DNA-protecting protein DprA [Alphaproteobacteria bacterium]|nr:DNA-protecting protein DprA [Alphaproteobacteria bacterium]
MPKALREEDLVAYLQLTRTDGIGAVTFQRLLMLYGSPQEALVHLPELAKRGGRKRGLKPASTAQVKKEIAATREVNGTYLVWGTAGYPTMLQSLPDAPPVIEAYGHLHLLEKPAIAMVGARNASAAALKLTQAIAAGVSARDFIIISGLARGIDGVAHTQSLDNGTIAVIANGIDHHYPPENEKLQRQILEQGLILTEHPLGTAPLARQFPRRNRIISGLAMGIVVTEAARKSGSLITARLAAEQGREVMAVPGSPLDVRCQGSNNLIREGASLVESADDVLEVMEPLLHHTLEAQAQIPPLAKPNPPQVTDPDRKHLHTLLNAVPIMIDELIEISGLPIASVHLILIELELAGRLTQEAGGKISLLD